MHPGRQALKPFLHVRRLVAPSNRELSDVLRVMRIAFAQEPVTRLVLAGDLSPMRVDGLHGCYLRAALVEGDGEVWIAELERPEAPGHMEIIGAALFFLPGREFLRGERQREAAKWEDFEPLLGEQQARWYLQYYLPRLQELWSRCLPPPGEPAISTYRLSKLAVLPGTQGLGVGSAIVRPLFKRAAREGRCILGQCASERSLQVYKSVGGYVLGQEDFVPWSGQGVTPIWAVEVPPSGLLDPQRGRRSSATDSSGWSEPARARL